MRRRGGRSIRRWKRLTVYTRAEMEGILIGKLIATSAKQIGMFLVILAAVSAAIVAFIIYTLTMDKIREIAVLKLIGTRNRTIASMIMQQALALGLIGFAVGKITATFAAPLFPKYVLLMPQDSMAGFFAVLVICALASVVAIRMALRSIRPKPLEVDMSGKGIRIEGLRKRYGRATPPSMRSRA
jgi:putative ABC transport system permease protein